MALHAGHGQPVEQRRLGVGTGSRFAARLWAPHLAYRFSGPAAPSSRLKVRELASDDHPGGSGHRVRRRHRPPCTLSRRAAARPRLRAPAGLLAGHRPRRTSTGGTPATGGRIRGHVLMSRPTSSADPRPCRDGPLSRRTGHRGVGCDLPGQLEGRGARPGKAAPAVTSPSRSASSMPTLRPVAPGPRPGPGQAQRAAPAGCHHPRAPAPPSPRAGRRWRWRRPPPGRRRAPARGPPPRAKPGGSPRRSRAAAAPAPRRTDGHVTLAQDVRVGPPRPRSFRSARRRTHAPGGAEHDHADAGLRGDLSAGPGDSPAITVLTRHRLGRLSVISATPSPGCRDTLIVSVSVQAVVQGWFRSFPLQPALLLLRQPDTVACVNSTGGMSAARSGRARLPTPRPAARCPSRRSSSPLEKDTSLILASGDIPAMVSVPVAHLQSLGGSP